jgi:hypothetical protein
MADGPHPLRINPCSQLLVSSLTQLYIGENSCAAAAAECMCVCKSSRDLIENCAQPRLRVSVDTRTGGNKVGCEIVKRHSINFIYMTKHVASAALAFSIIFPAHLNFYFLFATLISLWLKLNPAVIELCARVWVIPNNKSLRYLMFVRWEKKLIIFAVRTPEEGRGKK